MATSVNACHRLCPPIRLPAWYHEPMDIFLAKSVNEKTFEKLIGYPRNVLSSVGEREDTCWKNFFYGVKEYRDRFDLKFEDSLKKKSRHGFEKRRKRLIWCIYIICATIMELIFRNLEPPVSMDLLAKKCRFRREKWCVPLRGKGESVSLGWSLEEKERAGEKTA